MSKVFDTAYSTDILEPLNTHEVIKGGTGYSLDNRLPDEAEHICLDYSLYPELTRDTAYGFLTRGCPRSCHFCIVAEAESDAVLRGLRLYKTSTNRRPHGQYASVYVLTNCDTTMEENLYRIYTLRYMGFDPYVMICDKPKALREIRMLQRWCNNRIIFRSEPDFYKYDPKRKSANKKSIGK